MNALARLSQRLHVGARIECVHNTYLPDRDGERWRIDGRGPGTARIASRDRIGQMTVPTHPDGLVWLDEDTVRWPIPGPGGTPRRDHKNRVHTVTYRFLEPVGASR